MAERWLSVLEAAEIFGGNKMRVYRRIWRGELEASDESLDGKKPQYRISESSIRKYFTSRKMTVPRRGIA